MKDCFIVLAANLVSAIAVMGAIYLDVNDKPGWGWFLLLGIMCSATNIKFK